ncbi:MAG TPA: FtsX-like permease family protein [Ktedonobacteraceae bacterium]|jgi:putative ABC transport system permease protein|nr:FtsX-like permease family protein [Ktedonobacteraceae bacterium]
MLITLWLKGLLTYRSGRLLGAIVGIALTIAMLASIGVFIASSSASMTQRAAADVPVDWQVQLSPGTDSNAIANAIGKSTAYTGLEQVGYGTTAGFVATTGGTTQTTGPGKVVGLGLHYREHFPTQIRLLIGSLDGVLVAQQTASNLHATVGDTVMIQRLGLPSVPVKIAGVIDLPNADSLFQVVGVPSSATPQAPPDNVLILPARQWHQVFDPQATVHPDSVRQQFHVRITRNLPTDPNSAFVYVQQLANNLEARVAGSALIGNNLAARLDSVRKDALYALVLFLFLGLPGAILAMLLTMAVAVSGTERRRQEQALLRTRGASVTQILNLAALEAIIVGVGGIVLGIGLASLAAGVIASMSLFASTTTILWTINASLVGFILAIVVVLYPAWMQARSATVMAARSVVGRGHQPLWQRFYLDVLLLVIAALVFWRTASTGYQVILAPEGVPETSVAYETFLAPLCLWIGVALLAMRLCGGGIEHGRRALAALLRPIARKLAGLVSASLGRQHLRIARGVVLVALAFSFATSTAVFNTTYNAQARVDAELTNGADVTVTGSSAFAPSSMQSQLKALPGVSSTQTMQHRFAYVGNDLQDLYGIDPAHIGEATTMSNAFFVGGNAQAVLATLANHPDGILVSQETVTTYQLNLGDQINLRLQRSSDHQYHMVTFHFLGVVREFPTAPKDSFLIANANYIAQQTGNNKAEVVLMRTNGNPTDVALAARQIVKPLPGARVTDIGSTQRLIGSSLTSVDLRGLTNLELTFAILLLAGAMGLILALGLAERRRTFALLAALGARSSQLGAFLWSEGVVIQVSGAIIGIALGFGVAQMLVTILTGVFDPPPEVLAIPWLYLILMVVAAVASMVTAVVSTQVVSRRPVVEALRDL